MTNFEYQMRNHYGTLKQFREDMKINHITAARYFKDPDRIQLRFFKRLADKTGIPIETLISDKIVGVGELNELHKTVLENINARINK